MNNLVECLIMNNFIPDIGAFPDSVNVLEGVSGDVRTPEKLVDGVNDTLDGRHMWLAPILPNQVTSYFLLEKHKLECL